MRKNLWLCSAYPALKTLLDWQALHCLHLSSQRITIPSQQNWAAKLLGHDFDITYKTWVTNKAADTLSKKDEDLELSAISLARWLDWAELDKGIEGDEKFQAIKNRLSFDTTGLSPYQLVNGRLIHKRQLVLPANSPMGFWNRFDSWQNEKTE